ncbi:MAG: alpha/beta hydrolase [Anaerolineae bacterium]|jgi:pimeloyl-ACP methyl ester carboxylesterase
MPYAETEAGELFYTFTRRPEGNKTMVLVHGAGGSRLHWPAGLRQMPGTTVFTLDLPGHGRSGGDGCGTIDCYAAAVIAFLDEVGVDQAVVAGHSMGGAIAQKLALEAAERVSALVLIGTGARLRVAPAILHGIRDDFDQAVELITDYAWSPDAELSLTKLGLRDLRQTGAKVLLGDFLACDRFDVMDHLAEIKAPALVVGGTADRLTPIKYARYLGSRIPDARLVTVEGAGHMVMLERPQKVAGVVRGFVTELS